MNKSCMILSLLLLFMSTITTNAFSAQPYDGNHLLRGCRAAMDSQKDIKLSPEQENDAYFCLGVLMGVTSMHHVQVTFHRVPTGLCLPEEKTIDDFIAGIVKFSENNKYLLEKPAGIVAGRALYDLYPCK